MAGSNVVINMSEDDCDLLDSVYLPSKYHLGGVRPDFEPDEILCRNCLVLAERVVLQVEQMLEK